MSKTFTVAVAVQFEDPEHEDQAEAIALSHIPEDVPLDIVKRMTQETDGRRFVGYKWELER
jgi:hypothetical protein